MAKKFSLKIYKNYKLIHFPEENSFNQETNEHEYTQESKEFCLTYTEYIFNLEIDKPIFEVKDSFENIHGLFTKKNFAADKEKRDKFLLVKNTQQADIANFKLTYWEMKEKAFPQSLTVARRIQYLQTVLTEIDSWFGNNNIKPSSGSKPIKQDTILSNQLKVTKTLAAFMRQLLKNQAAKKYLKDTESNKDKMDYVKNAIIESDWIVNYTTDTLRRYIKPDKIIEFSTSKK